MAHVFGHLHRHARIIQAHHLEAGRQTQLQQGVHPGADVEEGLEPRLFVDELLGRRPDDGQFGLRGAGLEPGLEGKLESSDDRPACTEKPGDFMFSSHKD